MGFAGLGFGFCSVLTASPVDPVRRIGLACLSWGPHFGLSDGGMPWICVYRATGPADGFLVRDWLVRCGLTPQVRGDLSAIRGEIPIQDSWPAVWVAAADEERARQALRQLNGPRLVREPWLCPACGADGEPDFDSCWNCDADRP
jgi:hypothetical protein